MTLARMIVKLDSDQLHLRLQSILEQQWDVSIPVAGNSMQPLWQHNRDSVVLKSCERHELKKGDVVLYRRSTGQIVLHRIVKINQESYDLCGDAQVDIERNLPKSCVLAVMVEFYRKGKRYSSRQPLYRMYSLIWGWLRPLRRAAINAVRYRRRFSS